MKAITLDSLIEEGQKLRKAMKISMYGWSHPDNNAFLVWMETSKRFVLREFKDDRLSDDFEYEVINYKNGRVDGNNVDRLISILIACKSIPEKIEKRTKSSSAKAIINNNITQTQSQEQYQAIDIFIDAIKDEITGRQLKELKQIIAEEKEVEKVKPKILEKMKSFGIDVLSNIVANVVTNPNIMTSLGM